MSTWCQQSNCLKPGKWMAQGAAYGSRRPRLGEGVPDTPTAHHGLACVRTTGVVFRWFPPALDLIVLITIFGLIN